MICYLILKLVLNALFFVYFINVDHYSHFTVFNKFEYYDKWLVNKFYHHLSLHQFMSIVQVKNRVRLTWSCRFLDLIFQFQLSLRNKKSFGKKAKLWLRARVYLGVMTMKGYFTLFRAHELESHCQMQFSVISRTPTFLRALNPLSEIWSA